MKNKLSRLYFLILFFSCFFLKSQENVFKKDEVYTISKIEIEGTAYSTNQILEWFPIKIGSEIKVSELENRISFAFKKLFYTKLFEDISIWKEFLKEKNKIRLILKLKDLSRLEKVEVKGIKTSVFEEITKERNLKKGLHISAPLLWEIKEDIKNHFIEKGYPEVQIKFDFGKKVKQNTILNLYVDKGPRMKVKFIFEGNEKIPHFTLKNQMKNTKSKIFRGSKYSKEKFEEDLNKLIEKYHGAGYRDAKVLSYNIDKKGNFYEIKIKIEEGKRYYLGEIRFIGNSVFSDELLHKIIRFKKDDPYNKIELEKNISDNQNDASISSNYLDRGYINSQIVLVENLKNENQIALDIHIEENKKAHFNKISFEGNTITKDKVVTRELSTYPGDVFSKYEIKRTLFGLSGSGFFDPQKIIPDIIPNPREGTVDLNWKLVEKNSSQIQLQGGYGGDLGLTGTLSLTFTNFAFGDLLKKKAWRPIPQGEGQTLRLAANRGRGFQSYEFSFMEPWIGGSTPTSLNFGVNYSKLSSREDSSKGGLLSNSNANTNVNEKGLLNNIGANVGIRKRLNWPDNFFIFDLSLNYDYYDRKGRNLGFEELPLNGYTHDLNLGVSIERNSSGPNPVFPTSGSNFNLSSLFTLPYSLFTNRIQDKNKWIEYYKLKFKGNWYKEIIGKLVGKISGEFGFLSSYNKNKGIPPFQRFLLGGVPIAPLNMGGRELLPLRGYPLSDEPGSITPKRAGVIYNKFLFELRYPVLEKGIQAWVLGFFEGGNISDDYKGYNPFDLKKSIGFGFRTLLPMIGLFGLDFGYGINRISKSKWGVHLVLGRDI